MDESWFRWALGVSEMTWTDEEMKEIMHIGGSLAANQKVRQKNLMHWFKGYTMGLSLLTSLFTYPEFKERWKKANEI